MTAETDLIQKIQNGETQYFSGLYDAYADKIYRFIYYKTYHTETAEDLTSQTFFKAFEKIDSFDASKGKFSSWIYTIAQNNITDHFRSHYDVVDIDSVLDLSDSIDIERDVDVKMKLEQVESYIKTLKPEQRELVIMRLWQDLSFAEIAEILGKSEASCKMTYKRTIESLRAEMPFALFLFLFFNT